MRADVAEAVELALAATRPWAEAPPAAAPRRGGVAARLLLLAALVVVLVQTLACSANRSLRPRPGAVQRGVASWYGPGFHGRTTASGEVYDMHGLSAAHRDLPLGSVVEVRNLDNGRTVRLRVNDRGPYVGRRILDVSYGAAQRLGMIGPGVAEVEVRVVSIGGPTRVARRETSPPARVATATDGAEYTVQVGAFRDPTLAEQLRERLAASHPDVRVAETIDGWVRVHVGRFTDRFAAEAFLADLRRLGQGGLVVAVAR